MLDEPTRPVTELLGATSIDTFFVSGYQMFVS